MTTWKDSLQNKVISFKAKMTTWKDSLQDKVISFKAKMTTWKDSLQDKVISFKAKMTTWKDSLQDKVISFKANVKQGWTGSLADKLGIGTITSWLNLKTPRVVVSWGSVTVFGKTWSYPKGFDLQWYANGGILDGAQIFGRAGNTLLGGGEAGKEAVLPLERNTWWMDKIADKVAQRIMSQDGGGDTTLTVQLVLDGKIITQRVIRDIKQQTRTTGKNPLSALI